MNVQAIRKDFEDNAPRALDKLMTRMTDTWNGFEKIVDEAEEDFKPLAQEFRELHAKHVNKLRALMSDAGLTPRENSSFMSQVHEAVVSTRAAFHDVSKDILPQIRSGEQHVLNAFDAAINEVQSDELTAKLAEMRNELADLVNKTRQMK